MIAYYPSTVLSGMDIAILVCLTAIAASLVWIALHHQMIPIYEDDEFYDDEEEEDDYEE